MKENLLSYKPNQIKNDDVKCIYEDNKIVIIYPKKFGRIEKWVKNKIGGTEEIRRPLDKFTTFIWEKCDGNNNIAQIKRPSNLAKYVKDSMFQPTYTSYV